MTDFTLLQTNQPPTVWVTFPPAGGILATNQPVLFTAEAADTTTATALNVEFFLDGVSLAVTNSTPPTMPWSPTLRAHTLYAVATDSYGVSTTSSNVVFFVAAPVLDNGGLWRGNGYGTNVPNSWRQLTFDDSHWGRGRAPFGFGYADIRTLTPSNYNNTPIPTFFFRQIFTTDPSTYNYASITLTRDDAAVVWLNNQILARINLSSPTLFTNLALTNVVNFSTRTNAAVDIIPVPLSMLVAGSNILAVEVHQGRVRGLDNFDLNFDLSFSTFQYYGNPALYAYPQGNQVNLQWLDTFSGWLPQQSSNLVNWVDLTNTVSDSNGWFNVWVSPVTGPRQDFFRLRHPYP